MYSKNKHSLQHNKPSAYGEVGETTKNQWLQRVCMQKNTEPMQPNKPPAKAHQQNRKPSA